VWMGPKTCIYVSIPSPTSDGENKGHLLRLYAASSFLRALGMNVARKQLYNGNFPERLRSNASRLTIPSLTSTKLGDEQLNEARHGDRIAVDRAIGSLAARLTGSGLQGRSLGR
jgi:hypothetical protein